MILTKVFNQAKISKHMKHGVYTVLACYAADTMMGVSKDMKYNYLFCVFIKDQLSF